MAGYRGGGMQNMQSLMKQAQKMQEQMQEANKELDEYEVVGLSGEIGRASCRERV